MLSDEYSEISVPIQTPFSQMKAGKLSISVYVSVHIHGILMKIGFLWPNRKTNVLLLLTIHQLAPSCHTRR